MEPMGVPVVVCDHNTERGELVDRRERPGGLCCPVECGG